MKLRRPVFRPDLHTAQWGPTQVLWGKHTIHEMQRDGFVLLVNRVSHGKRIQLKITLPNGQFCCFLFGYWIKEPHS